MCLCKKNSVIFDVIEMVSRVKEIYMVMMWLGRRVFELGLGFFFLKFLLYEFLDCLVDFINWKKSKCWFLCDFIVI